MLIKVKFRDFVRTLGNHGHGVLSGECSLGDNQSRLTAGA